MSSEPPSAPELVFTENPLTLVVGDLALPREDPWPEGAVDAPSGRERPRKGFASNRSVSLDRFSGGSIMSQEKSLDILKGAILLERRGRSFYQNVAGQAKNEAVKQVFETRAEEEQKHIEFLARQYKSVEQGGKFEPVKLETAPDKATRSVLTKGVKSEILAAGFEAAAISAAMSKFMMSPP